MTTSYDKQNEAMTIVCDTKHCFSDDNYEGTFAECLAHFKEQGWKTFKDEEGEWRNSCADCFEKWRTGRTEPKKEDAPIVYPE